MRLKGRSAVFVPCTHTEPPKRANPHTISRELPKLYMGQRMNFFLLSLCTRHFFLAAFFGRNTRVMCWMELFGVDRERSETLGRNIWEESFSMPNCMGCCRRRLCWWIFIFNPFAVFFPLAASALPKIAFFFRFPEMSFHGVRRESGVVHCCRRENSWIMHIDGRSDAIDNRTFAYTQKGWTTRNLCAAIFVFASKLCAMCFESAENAFSSEKNNFLCMRFTHFFAVVWLFLFYLSCTVEIFSFYEESLFLPEIRFLFEKIWKVLNFIYTNYIFCKMQ